MTLRITQYGESILHEKGKKVESFDANLSELSKDMLEAMHQVQGIGLAAQQVGKAIRFCVVDVPDHPDYPIACILDGKPLSPSLLMPLSLANPQVTHLPSDEYYYEEGCLSFPDIRGDVARPERILFAIRILMVQPTNLNAMDCSLAVFNTKLIILMASSLLSGWKKKYTRKLNPR